MTKWAFLSYFLNVSTPMYGNEASFHTKYLKSIKKGDSCNTSLWNFSNHTGTHIDCPYHFSENGKKISDYSPEFWVINNCEFIDVNVNPGDIISSNHITLDTIDADIELLIIKTNFYRLRENKAYWQNNPGLHPDIADILRNNFKKLRMIGMDFISVSSFQNRLMGREAHKTFLNHDLQPILLIEDMNLSSIESNSKIIHLFIAPLLVENADASPCTIIAEVMI